MAKASRTGKKGKKTRVRKPVQRAVLTEYQSLLFDPCSANLLSPYGGERGFVQRFTAEISLVGSGNTCGYVSYTPSTNGMLVNGSPTSSLGTVPGAIGGVVGYPFLANAAKARPIAACFTVIPSAVSYTNLTGEIAAFVGSANSIPTVSTTCDSVMQLCNARSVLAKRAYEVKWFPGTLDSTYNAGNGNSSFAATDVADVNALVLCVRGFPLGITLNVRLTVILEWTPVTGIGIAASSTPGFPMQHELQAAALHRANPSWWHDFLEGVGQDVKAAGRYLGRKGLAAGVSFLENKMVPTAMRAGALLL